MTEETPSPDMPALDPRVLAGQIYACSLVLRLTLEALEKKRVMDLSSLRENLDHAHLLLAETFPLTGDHAEILKATEDQFAKILGQGR